MRPASALLRRGARSVVAVDRAGSKDPERSARARRRAPLPRASEAARGLEISGPARARRPEDRHGAAPQREAPGRKGMAFAPCVAARLRRLTAQLGARTRRATLRHWAHESRAPAVLTHLVSDARTCAAGVQTAQQLDHAPRRRRLLLRAARQPGLQAGAGTHRRRLRGHITRDGEAPFLHKSEGGVPPAALPSASRAAARVDLTQ